MAEDFSWALVRIVDSEIPSYVEESHPLPHNSVAILCRSELLLWRTLYKTWSNPGREYFQGKEGNDKKIPWNGFHSCPSSFWTRCVCWLRAAWLPLKDLSFYTMGLRWRQVRCITTWESGGSGGSRWASLETSTELPHPISRTTGVGVPPLYIS